MKMRLLHTRLNTVLDRAARPDIRLLARRWPAFQICGIAGLLLSIALTTSLSRALDLSLWTMGAIILCGVSIFPALVMATKIVSGREMIIYYHHEIAVTAGVVVLLWTLRQPILPYLDITVLGIGAFLACGRIGCFMVGCCHGRPHHWGVRYTPEHATAGFTDYYVGTRLFPIQLVESLWVACVVVVGVALIMTGHPAGSALTWYVVAYDLGRFFFEFMRGDPDRPYLWGFSQPQWISVVLMAVVVFGEQIGLLPMTPWHFLAAAFLVAAMLAIAATRQLQTVPKHRLLHPRHVREIAGLIQAITTQSCESSRPFRWTVMPGQNSRTGVVRIGETSIGVRVSAGKTIDHSAAPVRHYALSCPGGDMSEGTARLLAGLIRQLKHYAGGSQLIKGDRGVFHALFIGES